MSSDVDPKIAAVAIGRNEGQRLVKCLKSLRGRLAPVIYVDSGSTDGSVERAENLGAHVVSLDLTVPFSAARARNEGVEELIRVVPDIDLVQFIDGDCELAPDWIDKAVKTLKASPDVVVVCGRRREREPMRTIYNRLIDMEWDTGVGEALACGGDALMRVREFRTVGGYDRALICGEEPELCRRMRLKGWRILRIDAEMTLHDADLTRFSQWWKRQVRCGHGYAEMMLRHFRAHDLASGVWLGWAASLVGTLYLMLAYRIYRRRRRRGESVSSSVLYSMACILSKYAHVQGMLRFAWARWVMKKPTPIIEYKT
jgi:GT2 family glycosyltransferase